jgi:transcriptional regulator with XRE-family HTH domain
METKIVNLILAENVKLLREKMGYTQDLVAKYLGVPREIISFYENGHRSVTAPHLEKLANLFHIETGQLKKEKLDADALRIACAFRADGFSETDAFAIAWFQRVMKNYLRIQKLSNEVKKNSF